MMSLGIFGKKVYFNREITPTGREYYKTDKGTIF